MPTDCISYQNSGYFTKLIVDYLEQKPELQPLYNLFPTFENFAGQIAEKSTNYNHSFRTVLTSVLQQQYQGIAISDKTQMNINALASENTFTITTGHQLNLFTGPLYFLYKIISTINLCDQLKAKYPENNFVPIYWMATEDHDFEEINYFTFKGKKFRWNRESSGPVGHLSTDGLQDVAELFALELGTGDNAQYLKQLFRSAYLKHDNLADATRFLANELFAEYGLVIIDANDHKLKEAFVPHIKSELLHQRSHAAVTKSADLLKEYNIQVTPREINLFYIGQNLRERIIFKDGVYHINNTAIKFSEEELVAEVDQRPEHFSPNVIMRPLYQEVILPNLCYIGGGGEIAYWLELKNYFNISNVTFPMLLLRNSVLLATEKQAKKAEKLTLSWQDLFSKQSELVNRQVKKMSEFPIDLTPQKKVLHQQFAHLEKLAQQTDKSFIGAVKAQQAKQIKGLDNLEKRLLKAQKRKHAEQLQRITELQNELFPYNSLQERQANYSEFYLEYGDKLIPRLISELNPLEHNFNIIVL